VPLSGRARPGGAPRPDRQPDRGHLPPAPAVRRGLPAFEARTPRAPLRGRHAHAGGRTARRATRGGGLPARRARGAPPARRVPGHRAPAMARAAPLRPAHGGQGPPCVVLLRRRREAGDLRVARRSGRDLRYAAPRAVRPRDATAQQELPLQPGRDRHGQPRLQRPGRQRGIAELPGRGPILGRALPTSLDRAERIAGLLPDGRAAAGRRGRGSGGPHLGVRGRLRAPLGRPGPGTLDRRPRAPQQGRGLADPPAAADGRRGERRGGQSADRLAGRAVGALALDAGRPSRALRGPLPRGLLAAGSAGGARNRPRRGRGLRAFAPAARPPHGRRLRSRPPAPGRAARTPL